MNFENCLASAQIKNLDPALYGRAPAYEGAGTEEMIPLFEAYRSYYVLEHGAGEDDYAGYCKKLEACGFSRYASKTSNGNRFATYTDGENIVNVSCIRYRDVDRYVTADVSYVAIAVDRLKNCALPPKSEPYRAVASVQLTTDGTGFIIRLADGRFLVVDLHVSREEQTDRIYEELCRQNVREGKPAVAAWMITHAHGDHTSCLIGMLKRHGHEIDLQCVIHGFPAESTYTGKNYMEYTMDHESRWMTFRCNEIKRLMDEKMPRGKFIVAHAGQIFEYPAVRLEVLFTSENLYRQQMFDSNMSSVAYRFEMPTGSFLALGDAVDAEAKLLRKIHGKELKSDVVALAHHALNGGDEELYRDIAAEVAIWPNTLEGLLSGNRIGHYSNHFDVNSVKHNLILANGDPLMTLYAGMPLEELAPFDRKFNVESPAPVNFAARKNPKNRLTEADLAAGYGNAPRYYGAGDETETLVKNEAEKTYEITLRGVTAYNFEYYCNSLKRDGYWPMSKSEEGERKRAVYASPLNAVEVVFETGVISIHVGRAGVNALHRDHG